MGFFDFLKSVKAKVSAAFIKVFGKDAAQQFGDASIALLKSAAGVIVVDAVKLIEASNPMATPADKRTAAFNQVVSDAKTAGISLSTSMINMLIELAVNSIVKQNFIPVQ